MTVSSEDPVQSPNDDLFIKAALAAFPGAVIISDAERLAHGQAALRDSLQARRPFSAAGLACHANGWVVFPQQRSENRGPAFMYGAQIRYRQWAERQQTRREVAEMAAHKDAGGENVAAIMSAANGCFVLDLDVTDPELSARFARLAREMLGRPFRREYVGSEGKLGLIYATDPERDPVHAKRAYPVLTADGAPTGHVIEVLSNGAPYTLLGRHWKRGSLFQYDLLNPARDRATAAASVTATQLQAFLERASEEIALLGKLRGYQGREVVFEEGAVEGARVDADGLIVPGGVTQVRGVTWSPSGKVLDGRERFLRSRAFTYVLRNPDLASTPGGRHALAGALAREAGERFDGLGTHFATWHGGNGDTDVQCAARAKVESAWTTASGRTDFVERIGRDERGRVSLVTRVAVAAPKAPALAWLGDDALSTVRVGAISTDDQDRKRIARSVIEDRATREAGQVRVARALRETILAFAAEARAYHGNRKAAVQPVTIAKAPTGAGKTSLAVELLSDDVERFGPSGPKLFLLPSYNNIDEVVARARSGRKAKPGATAEYLTMANAAAAEARARGLRVEILTGKERGGCLMAEQLAYLRAQRQPASALCHLKERLFVPGAPADAEPVYEETWCRHHPDNPETAGACPVILARRKLADADIVFAPTVFLSNALPEGLKDAVAGMIVDERCLFELLNFATLPLACLAEGNRPVPALTAKERAEGQEAEGWVIDRDAAVRAAHEAIARGLDIAEAFYRDDRLVGCVEAAIRVCGRGQRSVGIKPNISMAKLADMFQVAERAGIAGEHRLWTLVAERIEDLRADAQQAQLVEAGMVAPEGLTWRAKGARDARIQVLRKGAIWGVDEDVIRLSWRDAPNLAGVPTLLLDASADADIIAKIWGGREVRTVEIPAYLHMRTIVCLDRAWASTSLDVSCGREPKEQAAIARDVAKMRRLETAIAGVHGWSRVATFAPKRVRGSLRTAHAEPENVDTGHYGAVRGLDFAKDHAAVVTIGRLEFPSWIYDAYAAGLTFDDLDPEPPFVPGDGEPAPEMPTVDRILPLRDGRDLTCKVAVMPGAWGRRIQNQLREEEQRQCGGRLRPVYRDGEPPTWIAVSSVFPEGIVVDGITTVEYLSTLKGAAEVHEAVRRVGVLDYGLVGDQAPEIGQRLMRSLGRSGIGTFGNGAAIAQGLDRYLVRVSRENPAGGERSVEDREVLLPASAAADPISAAVEAFDRSDIRVETIRLLAKGATPVPSQVRAPDALDEQLGSRDARREAEVEARAAARNVVPPRVADDVGEIFDMPADKRPPVELVHDYVDVEAILIATGMSPALARDAAAEERDARRARRQDARNRNPAQAPASRPAPGGDASA